MKKSALLFIVSILSGFLYTKAPFPVALLISGSGPTD